MALKSKNNFVLLFLIVLCGYSEGQLNFNLPSIFSRLSKTSQTSQSLPASPTIVAATSKQEPPQIVAPSGTSCSENDTHFELITG
jgi:hypothetical protein